MKQNGHVQVVRLETLLRILYVLFVKLLERVLLLNSNKDKEEFLVMLLANLVDINHHQPSEVVSAVLVNLPIVIQPLEGAAVVLHLVVQRLGQILILSLVSPYLKLNQQLPQKREEHFQKKNLIIIYVYPQSLLLLLHSHHYHHHHHHHHHHQQCLLLINQYMEVVVGVSLLSLPLNHHHHHKRTKKKINLSYYVEIFYKLKRLKING
mmetsp:Transcript_1488/g.1930  ORF Transcript_1488/g.1930 Transcript_1488/m.1930 type:complete len:208 (+) Transcript_1488:1417-2040(+)